MHLEVKPEQQSISGRAAHSEMSPDEVLDQAFAVIQVQSRNQDWMPADRDATAAHMAEGFAEAESGELFDPGDALYISQDRRERCQIA